MLYSRHGSIESFMVALFGYMPGWQGYLLARRGYMPGWQGYVVALLVESVPGCGGACPVEWYGSVGVVRAHSG